MLCLVVGMKMGTGKGRNLIQNFLYNLLDTLHAMPGSRDEDGDRERQGDWYRHREGSIVHLARSRYMYRHRYGDGNWLGQTFSLCFFMAGMRSTGYSFGHHERFSLHPLVL